MKAPVVHDVWGGTILVVVGVLASVGLVGAGQWFYRAAERHHRAAVEQQLSAIAELKVTELVNWRAERFFDAGILAKNRSLSALVTRLLDSRTDNDAESLLTEWLGTYLNGGTYDQIHLIDRRGVTRLSLPSGPLELSPAAAQRVPEVLRNGHVTFQDFYRSEVDHRVHLALLVPIAGEPSPGRPLGVIVMRIDPAVLLYPFIERWPTPSRTAETLIVRKEDGDVLFLNSLRFSPDAALTLRIPLDSTAVAAVQLIGGRTGVVDAVDYRGVPIVAALRRVPDSPWALVARVDAAEVNAPMRERLWQTVVSVSALLLATVASVVLVWRHRNHKFHREQAESAALLREGESLFLTTFEQAAVGMAHVAPDGRWLRANRRLCDVVGYTEAELRQGTFQDITHPEDLASDVTLVGQVLAGTLQTYSMEKRYVRKDRSIVWVNLTVSLVRDSSGAPAYFVSVVEDITERRAAEEEVRRLNADLEQRVLERTAQLEAANKELEAFSYSVSHDLRAPLRAISGYGRILTEDFADRLDSEGRRVLGVISGETRRMGQLVDDLLAFSRLGRQRMAASDIDMTALARTAFDAVAAREPARALQLTLSPLPSVPGDPAMIRVVWDNLLSNAIKFTEPRNPAVIEIGSQRHDGETVYWVKDDGVGFDMAYADKLFGVFQRLHSRDEFEGTGVGLALVQRIIHRHGGRVWAEGVVNAGAVFHFSLPDRRD